MTGDYGRLQLVLVPAIRHDHMRKIRQRAIEQPCSSISQEELGWGSTHWRSPDKLERCHSRADSSEQSGSRSTATLVSRL